MGFLDGAKRWFKGERRKKRAPGPSTSAPSGASRKDIEAFVQTRSGTEAYLEPRTAVYPLTLLMIAADGEYLRRPVRDTDEAESLCDKLGIPLYDAGKVGYPKRMREYERGVRQEAVALEDLPPWPGDDGEEPPHLRGV